MPMSVRHFRQIDSLKDWRAVRVWLCARAGDPACPIRCGYMLPIPRSSLSQARTVAATVSSADRFTAL